MTNNGLLIWVGAVLVTILFPFLLLYGAKIVGYGYAAGRANFHKRRTRKEKGK